MASAPRPLMRCLVDWVTPAAIDSVGEGDGAETSPGSRWTLPQQSKKLGWRDLPPEVTLTCPQETQGHVAEEWGAPGRVRQHRPGHFSVRALVFGVRQQRFVPPFALFGGLACDVTALMPLSL